MTVVHGTRLPGCEPEEIVEGVSEVLTDADPTVPETVVLVPDVHYPYHPSTGTVTNPDTVSALIDYLFESEQGVEQVKIARSATSWSDNVSGVAYLGYDRLVERAGVEYFDADAEPQVSQTVSVGDQETVVTAPESLLENSLVVPTLRRTEDATLAGCFDRLAATALDRNPTPFEVSSLAMAADPFGAVLDATYSYGGTPHRTRALLASSDALAVERVTAYLLGLEKDALPAGAADDNQPAQVRGLDVREVADALPNESITDSTPSGLVKSGYQLYTRVTGDQLPPQLMDQ